MMLKSSPTVKKAVKEAMDRLNAGVSDKSPTPQETGARLSARRKQASEDQIKKDTADLPNLEKQHAEMQAIHEKGKNWQYSDRDQNLSADERRARDIAGPMSNLGSRIGAAKRNTSSYAKGGKISAKTCSVSTAPKGKNNSCW
jgi:hypothetical protein